MVHSLKEEDPLNEILEKNVDVFKPGLGCIKGFTVQLQVDPTKPKFFKPRQVPFILKQKVETELERLQDQGIISPVQFSKWAAPIVPITKKGWIHQDMW